MKTRRALKCVPFVLCAMGLAALCLTGCRKEQAASEGGEEALPEEAMPSNSPAVYMKDAAFMKQLTDKRDEMRALLKERAPLVARMEELVRSNGSDRAVLQKLPEWNDLHKKVVELNARYEDARKRQLTILRERIAPRSRRRRREFRNDEE